MEKVNVPVSQSMWWLLKSLLKSAEAVIKSADDVAEDEMILDIGPESAARFWPQLLKEAGTIIWNGHGGRIRV